jgi:hypothetical protein
MTKKTSFRIGLVIALIIALSVAWWLASPLFIDRVVDEPLGSVMPLESFVLVQASAAPLAVGNFHDIDSIHKGSGTATFYELEDGSRILRFEPFDVTNGPDLHVYLSVLPDPLTSEEVRSAEYIDLGKLKGNVGNQNYEISAEVDLASIQSVVIYCQPFHVVFSVAPLENVQVETSSGS